MRTAAAIFLVFGFAYLAWDISLIVAHGVQLGSGLMVVFAAAVLYQGYALWKRDPRVRWSALVSAVAIAGTCAYIASVFIASPFPESLLHLPGEVLPLFGSVVALSIAFGVASVVLILPIRRRPNAP
ncbi:MAG TPA: hypothetical protein VHE58_05570 [Burkholderiales bacterium]|nr:hypothetical protein [Burkholderiales bacterium]